MLMHVLMPMFAGVIIVYAALLIADLFFDFLDSIF